jgi:hypothetical protein
MRNLHNNGVWSFHNTSRFFPLGETDLMTLMEERPFSLFFYLL